VPLLQQRATARGQASTVAAALLSEPPQHWPCYPSREHQLHIYTNTRFWMVIQPLDDQSHRNARPVRTYAVHAFACCCLLQV
jgi:hypothetical protein